MKQNENRTVRRKLNGLDWFLILLVITIAAGGYYYFFHQKQSQQNVLSHISYDMEVKEVSNAFTQSIKIGDTVKESTKGNVLGKVTKFDIKPATTVNPDTIEGKFKLVQIPDRYDVVFTVEASAQVGIKSIITDGFELQVGKKLFLKGKGYANAAYILAIRLNQ